jgi:hypothetical protein
MLPYYLLFISLGLFSLLDYLKESRLISRNAVLGFVFLILLIFIGFRSGVGIDWVGYLSLYNDIEPLNLVVQGKSMAPMFFNEQTRYIEIGYKILNSLFKTFGLDFKYMVFSITLFNLFSLYTFLKSKEIIYKFSFLLVYLALSMIREFDILRQSLALYIFLFSIKYVDVNYKKYFLINFIALLFHSSAIIFFIIYPFLKRTVTKKFLIIVLILYILSFLVTVPFISFILNFFNSLSGFQIFAKILEKYNYLYYPKGLGLTITLPCSLLLVMLIIFYPKYQDLSKEYKILINLFLAYIFISILFAEIEEVVTRLGYLFHIGIAFVFSTIPTYLKKNSRPVFFFVPIFYLLMKFYLLMGTEAARNTYTPYGNYLLGVDKTQIEKQNKLKKSSTEKYYRKKIKENNAK